MTLEELTRIRSQISLKSHDALVELALNLADEFIGEVTLRMEREQSEAVFAKEYRRVCSERDAYHEENIRLKAALKKAAEESQKKTRELFGRSTERIDDLLNSAADCGEIDEAREEDAAEGHARRAAHPGSGDRPSRHHGRRRKGKREEDLSKIRHEDRFVVAFGELDGMYGEGNWRIAFWHRSTTVEHKRPEVYALDTWTPVISIGLEHDMRTLPVPPKLIPGSLLSPSLGAEILCQKFLLLLPYYRMEAYFAGIGFPIARQLLSGWVIRLAYDYFALVYDYMKERLMEQSYHQCDETTLKVIHDGRSADAKSYIWVHSASELLDCHPIFIFCYELTRGTDHLREFYRDFHGYITCDAYCSYHVLEKERAGEIHVTGCLMHARRRFADALSLVNKSGMTQEQLEELPETKALLLLGRIFDADGALKALSAEERRVRRSTEVRPLVEKYYEFIEGIHTEDPMLSNTMKDAVNYSLNQRDFLCRFLEDGNIPCDNGSSERSIRALATARRSFLFCNTIDGAKALAIMFSIVETAKANGADVRCYLQYVLELMPGHMDDTDLSFLADMMPWSDKYLEYELRIRQGIPPDQKPDEYTVKPKTPPRRKKQVA